MLGFLKFILITFIVLTVLGYIFRFLLAIYLKRLAKKMSGYQEHEGKKEGETQIKNTASKEKVVDKNVGDYIDFEEVK